MNKHTVHKITESQDESEAVGWAWLAALINPFFLFQGLAEVFMSWLFTRPWRRLVLFLPAAAIVAAAFGLILYGSQVSRESLQVQYAMWADAELDRLSAERADNEDADSEAAESEKTESSRTPLMQEEKTSTFSDMLFRRLMRLNDQNPRTRYMVALQLARTGRISQARQMMQEISPSGTRGFAPAHAWLAVDLLSRKDVSPEERSKAMEHLQEALSWEGMSSGLLSSYAKMLASDGKRPEALQAMEKAAEKDPEKLVGLALMAKQMNVPKTATESSSRAKSLLQEKIKTTGATPDDYMQLMKVQLLDEELKAALDTGRRGLSKSPDNKQLKYLCSEALRLMYRQTIRKSDRGVELNLTLLDAAMKEYPENPFLAEDIAMLDEMGVKASPELKAVMENQLASGQATAVAHLLLANQEIKAGRLKQSVPHLEQSLKLAPTHPVTLNNLALVLALIDTGQIERAEELIDKAISINPRLAEFYDSQGEIRLIAGRPLDAIESLEKAIGLDPSRHHTHELLVKAYRAAGSEEMARVHEKFLAANPIADVKGEDSAKD